MKVDYVCNFCGGNDVSRDAWADWDAGGQQWVLRTAFDHAHCHICECETRLVAIDLETREPPRAVRAIKTAP